MGKFLFATISELSTSAPEDQPTTPGRLSIDSIFTSGVCSGVRSTPFCHLGGGGGLNSSMFTYLCDLKNVLAAYL